MICDILKPKVNEKVCIVVYGNIASGKSTFVSSIRPILIDYSYVCLDDVRLKHEHSSTNKLVIERKCEEECFNQIFKSRLLIYETTGASLFFNRVKGRLRGHFKTLYVYINCDVSECHKRFDLRKKNGYKQVMPPFRKGNFRELLYYIKAKHYDLKIDLELNSETSTTDEMFVEFKRFCYSLLQPRLGEQ